MNYFIKDFVNNAFKKTKDVNTELLSKKFEIAVSKLSDDELCNLLIISGYIPDMYIHDSSEETLYTKLCEVLEVVWAKRMGFKSNFVTQKSSYEDVVIYINKSVIVSDTKTFRLGRSQAAPNVKDLVKPEDYRKWLARYQDQTTNLGGLVVFPQLHEWSRGSDAHYYCSDKNNPIVMLPFHYLAYLLDSKNRLNYETSKLTLLWDYKKIFPNKVKDRICYWKTVNNQILHITGDTISNFKSYLSKCEEQLYDYTMYIIQNLKNEKKEINDIISSEIDKIEDINELKNEYKKYKIIQEITKYDTVIERINKFRINTKSKETKYKSFIEKIFE